MITIMNIWLIIIKIELRNNNGLVEGFKTG